jgi:NAD dependent epimerase/dehydratase
MKLSGRNVFVTGADGFIGSHLSKALVEQGANVTALSQYNSFDAHGWLDDLDDDILSSINLVRGDIRDQEHMYRLCCKKDIVFHLAALIAIPYSYDSPSAYAQTNVQGTINVLLAAKEAGCSRVVHTSTSEVYGTAQFTPITEKHPLQGQSPYSASKIGADMMAESFQKSFGLPVVTLRPFNTYGPRQSERAVIPTVIRQMLDPICEDIRLGDTSTVRDFMFVEDTAAAFIAASLLPAECEGLAFNAGTGFSVTIGEMVEMACSVINCDKKVVTEALRKRPSTSEVYELLADHSLLSQHSNWQPSVSLADGLRKTIEWWQPRIGKIRRGIGYMI